MEQFIVDWIKAHKNLISVRTIEKETGMPPHTLQKVMQGKRHLPEKWKHPLLDYIDKVTEKWVFPGTPIYKYIDPVKDVDWERMGKFLKAAKRKKRNDYLPSMSNIVAKMMNGLQEYNYEVHRYITVWEKLEPGAVYDDPAVFQRNRDTYQFTIASHLLTIEDAIKHLTRIKELIKRDITAHDKTEDHQQTAIDK